MLATSLPSMKFKVLIGFRWTFPNRYVSTRVVWCDPGPCGCQCSCLLGGQGQTWAWVFPAAEAQRGKNHNNAAVQLFDSSSSPLSSWERKEKEAEEDDQEECQEARGLACLPEASGWGKRTAAQQAHAAACCWGNLLRTCVRAWPGQWRVQVWKMWFFFKIKAWFEDTR